MALAILARDYCNARNGDVLGLIVDHGLRPDSAQEARKTAASLQRLGISNRILMLDLKAGPAVQARARMARYQALAAAALSEGFLYLALGHHQADQYETVAMRTQRGTGGGEGMAAWTIRGDAVFLRPLLGIHPALLRSFLLEQEVEWVEDPSNQHRRFERVRIRQDQGGQPPRGVEQRVIQDHEVARFLARHGTFYPEGYAILETDMLPDAVLGALIRTIGGRIYAPKREALQRLAAGLRPATLGGVRIMAAGRLGAGWLLVREPSACAPSVCAVPYTRWDERFMLLPPVGTGMSLGALGAEASLFKGYNRLPTVVLQGLPALRNAHGRVVFPAPVSFAPPMPMAQRAFIA